MDALPTRRATASPARWLLAVSLFVGALPPASAGRAATCQPERDTPSNREIHP